MPDIETFLDRLGQVRRLGYVRPDPSKQVLRAARTNIQTVVGKLIPQTDWIECDYVTGFPTDLINNQGQEGACVGASGCGGSARQHYMRTGEVLQLSWQYLYDQINGGQDNGANIIDSMTVLQQVGVPLMSVYPKSQFRANLPLPPGSLMYKEDVAITVGSSMECATALIMGFLVQAPIFVTNANPRKGIHDFEEFTVDGVAWGGIVPRGNASNHSIYLAGLKKINNVWFFRLVNSWGVQWGPFKNGTCLIPLAAIDNPDMGDDGYAHASVIDPNAGNNPVPSAA